MRRLVHCRTCGATWYDDAVCECECENLDQPSAWEQLPVEPGRFVETVDASLDLGIEGHPEGEAGWAHTAVVARYPSGTDPLAAIRESMSAFMERTDGTNAMPWWTRVRWWHGGPYGFKKGDVLRPPSETGAIPGLPITDKTSVYITSERDHAVSFAARHNRPMIYEVLLDAEPLPDDIIPHDKTSGRVPSCRVHAVETPSRLELRRVLYELMAQDEEEAAGPPTDVVDGGST